MSPEAVIEAQLARRLGSLSPGRRHPIVLEQIVDDGVGRRVPGPHTVGWVELTPLGGLRIRLLSTTRAGTTARALLEEELLDVVVEGFPAVVRLTDLVE